MKFIIKLKMHSIKDTLYLLIFISKLTKSIRSIKILILIYYLLIKIDSLFKMQLKLQCVPSDIFSFLIMKHGKCNRDSIDDNLHILCNSKDLLKSHKWFYLCTKSSKKKFKVAVIFIQDAAESCIYVSESMKFNINRYFQVSEDCRYSLYPLYEDSSACAINVNISLISNPYNCAEEMLNTLLKNYFILPKYLRKNDIFKININKYIPELKYNIEDSKLKVLHFKVNNVKSEFGQCHKVGNFALYGTTTLTQDANIQSYLPNKCLCDIFSNTKMSFSSIWLPTLKKPLKQIQSCILPFLQKNVCINVKPLFLVEGLVGSGKTRLITIAAETLGLHLLKANFTEIQSLTSAQTEAKMRIILHEAETCVPCILMLENIQVFGINSEGQKNDRVISSFINEINKLFSKKLKYPVIIIATSTDSEIPIDAEKTFVEKIILSHLNQDERFQALSWFIKKKGFKCSADLQKISKMCSNFVLADIEVLVLYAIKNRFKQFNLSQNYSDLELTNENFIHACEHMQSIFSDEIGAPRVPKIYWDDIGGLIDLKREIMRRIKMPLLNISGMSRSGLLLYGPPGTGKTLLAKAVATECQLHFLSVKGPELLNMYVGQSEKNVRQVFERARAASPCIIFFDEFDSLAPNRGNSGDSGGVMDRVVSQLLAEMDGLESTGNVFIIAATNRPDLIDPALLRPGRFDKMLYVGIYSDCESQKSVLKALTRQFKFQNDGKELDSLIKELPDHLTGADLYSICSNAWLTAVRRTLNNKKILEEKVTVNDIIVNLQDFLHASKNLVPSVSREEILRYEKLKEELSSR